MPAVCSVTSVLHACGPQLSQLAPWQSPELPIQHEAVLLWDMADGCPVAVTPGILPTVRLGQPCAHALCPARMFRGRFTWINITRTTLLSTNCSEGIS